MERDPNYYGLYASQVEEVLSLQFNEELYEVECKHFPVKDGKWERSVVRYDPPLPDGTISRRIALCVPCYQKLRRAGYAPHPGLWGPGGLYA